MIDLVLDHLYLIVTGAGTARRVPGILPQLAQLGPRLVVIPTPNGARVVSVREMVLALPARSPHRVVESYFDEAILPSPPFGLVVVAPCSFRFEPRWGHHIDVVEVFRSWREDRNLPRTRNHVSDSAARCATLLARLKYWFESGRRPQHLRRRCPVGRRRGLELRWSDARVDLRRVDARVAEQRAHFLEAMVLLEHFHRDAVAQVVRFELGTTDELCHRLLCAASA